MNKKGITPVVAIVLLLMMTVGAAGAAYAWFSGLLDQYMGQTYLTEASWDESVCDAGTNVINSTVSNDGSKIPTDGGGTFLVKRDGRIVCEKNLSATDIGGGGLGDDHVWNKGETVSYDMNVSSSPYCSSGMIIESNQDYSLELKISERSRSTISTSCSGKHY